MYQPFGQNSSFEPSASSAALAARLFGPSYGYRPFPACDLFEEDDQGPTPPKKPRTVSPPVWDLNAFKVLEDTESFLDVFRRLYMEKQMCDVTLKVGNKQYGAHRLMLSTFSEVFQAMLIKGEWNECHEQVIELKELPECEENFATFLEYFYTGKIALTHENAMPILALADKYLVKGLTTLCLEYMQIHMIHVTEENLVAWCRYAQSQGHTEVTEMCLLYATGNNYLS